MEIFIDSYRLVLTLKNGFLAINVSCPSIGSLDMYPGKNIYDHLLFTLTIYSGCPLPTVIKMINSTLEANEVCLSEEDVEKIKVTLMAEFSQWYDWNSHKYPI